MNVIEREKLILELLEKRDFMMVEELTEMTGVSKATIRRDLQEMENAKKVKRFRGGVCLNSHVLTEDYVPMKDVLGVNIEEKKQIAKAAAALIEDGDVIFIDSGSTTYCMIDYIEASDIYVVTNSIHNAMVLANKRIKTYILGGEIKMEAFSVLGEDLAKKIEGLNFDKSFLGVRGVDAQAGYSTTNQNDSTMKSSVIKKAAINYVLADSSKIGKRKFCTFAQLTDAICITTQSEQVSALPVEVIFA